MKKHFILSLLLLSGAAVSFAQSIPTNVPTNGLVAYYGFDGNANDLSGNDNDGTLANAGGTDPSLTTDRFGNANSAYQFGGVDNANWIRVPNSATLQFNNTLTISFWMMQTSARGTDRNVCWYYAEGGIASDNTLFAAISKGGGNAVCNNMPGIACLTQASVNTQTFRFSNTFTDPSNSRVRNADYNCYAFGEWIHCVVTIDTSRIKLYINGSLVFQNTELQPINFSDANVRDLFIGAMQTTDNMNLPFSGKLDDIAIYNRCLAPEEVSNLFDRYEDPNASEPSIRIEDVTVVNPCGTNNGTVTITPRTVSGVTYQYGIDLGSLQDNKTISAAPGDLHYYIASTCRQWDTTITLVCDCANDPSLVSYDTICYGKSGSGGKENDSILFADFESSANYHNSWSSNGFWECASGESHYDLLGYPSSVYGPHSGNKAYFCSNLNYNGSFNRSVNYLTSPAVTFPKDPSSTPTTLSFYFISIGISDGLTQQNNSLRLEYSTSSSGPWTTIWSQGNGQPAWSQVTLSLSNLISNAGTYFFRFTVDGIGYMSAFDDFVITTDTRWSIPDEVSAAAPDSTVRVEKEISFSGACPVTEITFWYVTPPQEKHLYREICPGSTGNGGNPNETILPTATFESGTEGWTATGYWARATGENGYQYLGATTSQRPAQSGQYAFFCSNLQSGAQSTYFPRSTSNLTSPAINIGYDPETTPITLTFKAYAAGFNSSLVGAVFDTLYVQYAASPSGPWVELKRIGGQTPAGQPLYSDWASYTVTLSEYIPEAGTYYIRFVTSGAGYSTGVDDIQITANTSWIIPDTVTNGTPGDTILTTRILTNGEECISYEITHWAIFPIDTIRDTIDLCPNATADTIPAIVRNAALGDTIATTDTLVNTTNNCDLIKLTYWCIAPIDTTADTMSVCLNDTSAAIPATVHAAMPGDTVVTIDTITNDNGCLTKKTTHWFIYPLYDSVDTVRVCFNDMSPEIPDTIHRATPGDTIMLLDTVNNENGCPTKRTTYWCIYPIYENDEAVSLCPSDITSEMPESVRQANQWDTITIIDTTNDANGCPIKTTTVWSIKGNFDTNIYRSVCPGSSGTFGDTNEPILTHNFEINNLGWTADGFWERATGESNFAYMGLPSSFYTGANGSRYAFFCPNLQTSASGGNTYFPSTTSNLTSSGLQISHDPILTPIKVSFSAILSGFENKDPQTGTLLGTYFDTLSLYIATSPSGPWVEIWSITGPGHGPWTEYSVQLSSFIDNPGIYYFRFVTTGEGYCTGIDDFQLTADTRWTIPDTVTNAPAGDTIITTRQLDNTTRCSVTETTHWIIFPMDETADTVAVCQNDTRPEVPDSVRYAQPGDTLITEEILISDNNCRYRKTTHWVVLRAVDTNTYEEVCSSDPREFIPAVVRRANPGDTVSTMAPFINDAGCTVRNHTNWLVKDTKDTNVTREVCPGTTGAFGYENESVFYNDFESATQSWTADGYWARGRGESNYRFMDSPSPFYSAHSGSFSYFCSNLQTAVSEGNTYFPSTQSRLTSPGIAINYDPIVTPIKVSFYACISGFQNIDQMTGAILGTYFDTLILQYATSPDGPWTEIWRIGGSGYGRWALYSTYLSSFISTPGTYYFRFITQGAGYCTGIDDFNITANTYWKVPDAVTAAAPGDSLTTTRRIENTGACTTSEITKWIIKTSIDSTFKAETVCPGTASSHGYEDEEIKAFDLEDNAGGWTADGFWSWATDESNFSTLNLPAAACRANSGSHAFFCSNLQHDNTSDFFPITTSYLNSPAIAIDYDPTKTPIAVSFYAFINGFSNVIEGGATTIYYNTLILQYSSSPTGPWTELWRGGGEAGYGSWTSYSVDLSAHIAESGTYYFRFVNIGAGYCSGVDDFKVTANTYWSIPASVLSAGAGDTVTTQRILSNANLCYTTEMTDWMVLVPTDTVKIYDSVCPGESKSSGNREESVASHNAESRSHGWTLDGYWEWGQGESCFRNMDLPSAHYRAHGGTYAFFCSNLQTNSTNTYFPSSTSYLTSPATVIDYDPTLTPLTLSFYAYSCGFSSDAEDGSFHFEHFSTLILEISDSPSGPWNELWRIGGRGHGDWTQYNIDLSAYLTDSGTYYFRFVCMGPGYSSGVDDFRITADTYRSTTAEVTSAAEGSTVETERRIYNAVNCYTTEITYWYIKPTSTFDTTVKAIDGYVWGGNTYNTSDTYYQRNLTNYLGCDSTAILHLTIVPSKTVVVRYDTICPGETGYHTYMDTLYFEDFDRKDNSCWSTIKGPRANGFVLDSQICNTQTSSYCFPSYKGNSLFEASNGIVNVDQREHVTELINYYTSRFVTPYINIVDPSQTSLSFYFYSEAAAYENVCFDIDGYPVDCDDIYAAVSQSPYLTIYDEIGVLCRNVNPPQLLGINGEEPFTDIDRWTSQSVSLSSLPEGESQLQFIHVNKGGIGLGLDNILVYGPRRVYIPREASEANAGSIVITRDTIFGRNGCDTTIIEHHWKIRPLRTTTYKAFADLEYTWYDSTYTESGIYTYDKLTDIYGCDSIDTLRLTIRERYPVVFEDCDEKLQFPNVITPNGDGVNDRFYILGFDNHCYPHNELSIYNRWGARVFYVRDIETGQDSWEPTNMPTGTYFFRFMGSNPSGTIERFGVIEVLRE